MADDKIKALDPAAAPLATDAEGAGTPTPAAAAKADATTRSEIAKSHPAPQTFGAHRQRGGKDPLGLLLVAAAIILALAGVVTGIWGLG